MRDAATIGALLIVVALATLAPCVRAVLAADDEARHAVALDESAASLRAYATSLEARRAEGGVPALALWMGGRSVEDARARASAAEETERADAADDASLCAIVASADARADHARTLLADRLRTSELLAGADRDLVQAVSDAVEAATADPCGLGLDITAHHELAPFDAAITWPAQASLVDLSTHALSETPRDAPFVAALRDGVASTTSGHFGPSRAGAALTIDVGVAFHVAPLLDGVTPSAAGLRAVLTLVLAAHGGSPVTWTTDVALPPDFGVEASAQLAQSADREAAWAELVRTMIDTLDARALEATLAALGLDRHATP